MNLEQLAKDVKRTGITRDTQETFKIASQYDGKNHLTFLAKPHGSIEIKWSGWLEFESEEEVECDQGHKHRVLKEETWVWDYNRMKKQDVANLIRWLIRIHKRSK